MRQQIEVIEQGFHRRVEPVDLAQLQRQAFPDRARHHAGRIAALQLAQDRLDHLEPQPRRVATSARSPRR